MPLNSIEVNNDFPGNMRDFKSLIWPTQKARNLKTWFIVMAFDSSSFPF